MKLKNRLLVWTFSVFFFPLFLFIILFELNTYTAYKKQYISEKEESLKKLEQVYENKIENISGNIDVLADETRSLKAIDTAKISESINFLKKINIEYEDIFYIDSLSGVKIIEESKNNELNKIFDNLKDNNIEFFISNPYLDKVSNKNVITFIKIIKNNNLDQKIIGITVSQDYFNTLGIENSRDRFYLVKNTGEILSTNSNISGASFYNLYNITNNNTLKDLEGDFTLKSNNQKTKFRYQKLEVDKVYVMTQDLEINYYKKLFKDLFIPLALCLFLPMILFILLLFFFQKMFITQITKYRQSINRIIGLDKNSELLDENDELESMDEKFDYFSKKINNKSKVIDKNIKIISDKTYELSKNQALNYKILGEEQQKMGNIKQEVTKLIGLSEINSVELGKLIKECEHIVKENKNITLMTESLRRNFQKLNESSVSIEEMIDNINLISDRTNLLSLNARKEAERVSEYGESYSIIAEEIRNLSILILEISNRAKEISHSVTERIAKGNQVMDLTITKINKLQTEVKIIDGNVKMLYENVNLENVEEYELNKTFSELETLIINGKEKLTTNIKLINELNIFFREIIKVNDFLEKRNNE
ncbi:MAG: hypothetical protein KBF12_07030 [Sebaldella sp.]|nr:hypothetical protein [Sebaldella sp.]